MHVFRKLDAAIVIAEYGTVGVRVMNACTRCNIPLVVYFRGFDASAFDVLRTHQKQYSQLFRHASAIVAVSQSIRHRLISLGADGEKIIHNPSGADCKRFNGANPGHAPPVFLAVGRFAEKKAPHLTIIAFAELFRRHPDVRLRMIGDGPLFGFCRELIQRLQIESAVELMGAQSHSVVVQAMRNARAFVQHSVVAASGDSEGTPVSIMEAGASGLPVVSTCHGGIPEVVLHKQTGLLVDEHDVSAMAEQMLLLAEDPLLAARLGQAAQHRIQDHFSQQKSVDRLWNLVQSCVTGRAKPGRQTQNSRGTAAA